MVEEREGGKGGGRKEGGRKEVGRRVGEIKKGREGGRQGREEG